MKPSDQLTTKEVAALLGVTQRRVAAMITAGRLKAEKYGGTYLVRRRDLASVQERKVGRPRKEAQRKPTETA